MRRQARLLCSSSSSASSSSSPSLSLQPQSHNLNPHPPPPKKKKKKKKKQRNGSAILKLLDANPHVLWFVDKPARAAGALDADLFLSRAFSADNGTGPWLGEPNAVVLGMGPGGASNKANKREEDDQAAVVTLRNPSIDSKGAISFEAEVIEPAGGGAAEAENKKKGRSDPRVSSEVARNYLRAGERREGEGEGGAPVQTHLLESVPSKKLTWENVQLFIDDYYLEQPAAQAPPPPPPPPPTVVVVQAPPPPPPPPAPRSSYQSSIWNRIDGPQPIDAYRCGFMGGCGYGGFGLGGFGR